MPRVPRSFLPSPAWYHVTCRGVEQRAIVLDDRDREAWFKLFVEVRRRFGWKIHVWVLLDNHFHLLVETWQPGRLCHFLPEGVPTTVGQTFFF